MAARVTMVPPGECATQRARTETRTASSGALRWTRCTATTVVYATMTSNWPARTTPRKTVPLCEFEYDHPSFTQTKPTTRVIVHQLLYGYTMFSGDYVETVRSSSCAFFHPLFRCDTLEPVVVYRRLNAANKEEAPGVARKLQKWRENQRWKTMAKWQGDADNDAEPRFVAASCAVPTRNRSIWWFGTTAEVCPALLQKRCRRAWRRFIILKRSRL